MHHDGTVTLTGYLGNDPRYGATAERTRTVPRTTCCTWEIGGTRRPDDFTMLDGEEDVTVPSRDYAVLSLATHRQVGGRKRTTWHRIVVWNVDRTEYRAVRTSRKGDRVRVTGRLGSFTTDDGRPVEQVQLDRLEILQSKPRFQVP